MVRQETDKLESLKLRLLTDTINRAKGQVTEGEKIQPTKSWYPKYREKF